MCQPGTSSHLVQDNNVSSGIGLAPPDRVAVGTSLPPPSLPFSPPPPPHQYETRIFTEISEPNTPRFKPDGVFHTPVLGLAEAHPSSFPVGTIPGVDVYSFVSIQPDVLSAQRQSSGGYP